jgi:HAE1 family hydrophobic/amphiphilic exporter-1
MRRWQARASPIILKDWSERGSGENLISLFKQLNASLAAIEDAGIWSAAASHPGVGNDAGFTMQIELRDGNFDLAKLQSATDAIVANADTVTLALVLTSFRSGVCNHRGSGPGEDATLQVSLDQVFSALAGYLGSSYVDQFNKFGRYSGLRAGGSQSRLRLEDINNLTVRNKEGDMNRWARW